MYTYTRKCTIDCGTTYLTPVLESDIPFCCKWINDPEALDLISLQKKVTLIEEREWLLGQGSSKESFMIMLKQEREDLVIGMISVFNIQKLHGTCELETWIGVKEYRNQGHGSQIRNCLVNYLFTEKGMRKIISRVVASNHRSRRSVEKSNFVLEATLKDHVIINNAPQDLICYARFK